MRRHRVAALAAAALAMAIVAGAPASADGAGKQRKVRHVLFVGNNWGGTADVIRPRRNYRRIARLNIIPDIDERMTEILTDPVRLTYFLAIRLLIGEARPVRRRHVHLAERQAAGRLQAEPRRRGRDQDQDGRGCVALPGRRAALGSHGRLPRWQACRRLGLDGQRRPILNMRTGREVGRFPSGDSPHENTYTTDGDRIYHASIGLVYTPADQPLLDSSKGKRWSRWSTLGRTRSCGGSTWARSWRRPATRT
jgi:hypothetical protein